MKKIFIAIMAMAAFAACTSEETIVAPKGNAIAFGNAFIDNATKAIDGTYTNVAGDAHELKAFNVYGTVENGNGLANIFNGLKVEKQNSGAWAYDPEYTQYWVADNVYDFAAVVSKDKVEVEQGIDGMPVALGYDAVAQHDLLYAEVKDINYANNVQPVKFTFAHLLSKVKFTVKNLMQNGNGNSYKVKNVVVNGATKSAIYDIATKTWGSYAETHSLTFGDIVTVGANDEYEAAKKLEMNAVGESKYERLFIPQDNAPLNISIDVEYYVENKMNDKDVLNDKYTKTIEIAHKLEAGHAYNVVLTLGNPGEPITFAVEDITAWEEETVETTKTVTTAEELAKALAIPAVNEVVLANDIDLSETITRAEAAGVTISKTFTLDGNGHTLTYPGSDRAIDVRAEEGVVKNVTIKNLNINCSASYCQRGINFNNTNGTLTLEHVKVYGPNTTYAVNFPGKSDGVVANISQSELVGNIALNVWGENMTINVDHSKLTSVDNAPTEGYSAVVLNNDGATSAEGSVINLTNCEVVALDEKGEPSYATKNATATGTINWNEATTFVGTHKGQVAIVYYTVPADQFYSCTTLERAIEKAIETKAAGVRLTSDTTIDTTIDITSGKVVLDLNGHTLTSAKEGAEVDAIWVRGDAELVVTGNGTINSTYDCIYATGDSKVTIENGTFNCIMEAVYAAKNARVEILGGTFKVENAEYGQVYTLNLKGGSDATISVKGGTYYNFNPAESKSENPQANFVAAGYKAVEADGWYTVVAE